MADMKNHYKGCQKKKNTKDFCKISMYLTTSRKN